MYNGTMNDNKGDKNDFITKEQIDNFRRYNDRAYTPESLESGRVFDVQRDVWRCFFNPDNMEVRDET